MGINIESQFGEITQGYRRIGLHSRHLWYQSGRAENWTRSEGS